jgi:hypothetical protein
MGIAYLLGGHGITKFENPYTMHFKTRPNYPEKAALKLPTNKTKHQTPWCESASELY